MPAPEHGAVAVLRRNDGVSAPAGTAVRDDRHPEIDVTVFEIGLRDHAMRLDRLGVVPSLPKQVHPLDAGHGRGAVTLHGGELVDGAGGGTGFHDVAVGRSVFAQVDGILFRNRGFMDIGLQMAGNVAQGKILTPVHLHAALDGHLHDPFLPPEEGDGEAVREGNLLSGQADPVQGLAVADDRA